MKLWSKKLTDEQYEAAQRKNWAAFVAFMYAHGVKPRVRNDRG